MPASVETALNTLSTLSGFVCAALVDSQTGSVLGMKQDASHKKFNIELAAANNAKGMADKLQTIDELDLDDAIEDILIVLGRQYHVVHPVPGSSGVFFYCVLERENSNIFHVRRVMEAVVKQINIQAITV